MDRPWGHTESDMTEQLTLFTFKAKMVRMSENGKRGKRRCPM